MSRQMAATEPKALELVEQAVYLLRRGSASALAEYYLGSMPFILAVLYFWSDMSRNPMGAWYCGPSSAGVALTFVWMKIWQVRFCRRLWCRLRGAAPESWSGRRMLATSARQCFLHALGLIVLPLSALVAIPLGWVYAFYQNLSVLDDQETRQAATLVRGAKEQALLWPGQNHLILTIISLFGLFVFLNLALTVLGIPYLLKWMLGIETVFTLSGIRLLNTTFLAVLCGLSYLCTDPIVKAVYVLRCFYGRSRQTGEDLRSALQPYLRIGAALLLLVVLAPVRASAARSEYNGRVATITADHQNYANRLDETIQSVLQQRRFAWRLPRRHPTENDADQGWIASTIHWILDGFKAVARTLGGWIDAFVEWLKDKLPDVKPWRRDQGGDYRGVLKSIFYILGIALAVLLFFWIVRRLLERRKLVPVESEPDRQVPLDLADENITAEDLPQDQWAAMAREMMSRNDLRHALRAFYLSVLALLADHQRITIARYKSNQDYTRELMRRAHAEPELLAAFRWCVGAFERTWYGMHPITSGQVQDFMNRRQRIADFVQHPA